MSRPRRYRCPLHRCGCWHDRFTPEAPKGVNRAHRRDAYEIVDAAEIRERQRKAKPGPKTVAA